LRAYGGRVCPLVCGARYEAKGDRCVQKTCPKGMYLNGAGSCYAQAAPRRPPPAGPVYTAPTPPPDDTVNYGNTGTGLNHHHH
jgi:hypothetical protein